ncbi:MAG: cob(I)yrinic acid a,c-diamide adenosyltransferase [Planctomycetaceae bacterium]|nr:cob(I)yrinic acid a,c-diamide adenosyltransferase [Planctomycetaceae bacterium]
MVYLSRIYTRSGDQGETSIGDGSRVSKCDQRIVASGSIDELNCCVGIAATCCEDSAVREQLMVLQHWLFDLGADLTCPPPKEGQPGRRLQIEQRHVDQLENLIDQYLAQQQPLSSFVLPGGSLSAAHLHLARAVCRRAEIEVLRLHAETDINRLTTVFLNRLSDLLFVMARTANRNGTEDVLWRPGITNGPMQPDESAK